ncbi:hypothetical protein [Treponema sp.]|uniref:hypothetical protein n=1 Tax=Treponema sp. TaxID=166 RepID=UPI0025FFB856|nr:hypothetical protein [Treponema sp.]MCR5218609.1 hypothetical protein [Treponema sp.]
MTELEKEAGERAKDYTDNARRQVAYECGFLDGVDFVYNKAKEDVKHDLMMKLKDEGIIKPLKDSILRNERLSSQEQQELCAWIECAIDFGENLDECAKELELLKAKTQWHKVSEQTPTEEKDYLVKLTDGTVDVMRIAIDGNLEPYVVSLSVDFYRDIEKWCEIPENEE